MYRIDRSGNWFSPTEICFQRLTSALISAGVPLWPDIRRIDALGAVTAYFTNRFANILDDKNGGFWGLCEEFRYPSRRFMIWSFCSFSSDFRVNNSTSSLDMVDSIISSDGSRWAWRLTLIRVWGVGILGSIGFRVSRTVFIQIRKTISCTTWVIANHNSNFFCSY